MSAGLLVVPERDLSARIRIIFNTLILKDVGGGLDEYLLCTIP